MAPQGPPGIFAICQFAIAVFSNKEIGADLRGCPRLGLRLRGGVDIGARARLDEDQVIVHFLHAKYILGADADRVAKALIEDDAGEIDDAVLHLDSQG
jgi:hypothetical protein